MSVARLVAHAFVDGFDMFNNDHTVQLIDTSKRPKLKNIAAHVPQDIPELDGIGMSSTDWNAAIGRIAEEAEKIKDATSDNRTKNEIKNEMRLIIEDFRKYLDNN
jgi:hypothetical protein